MPFKTKISENTIGFLMRLYRNSPLHSYGLGRLLARLLSWVILLRKKSLIIKEINDVKYELDLNEVIDSSLYFSGTFEQDVEQIISRCLRPGMCILDIGANIGYHTFRMAKIAGEGGHVYAIEPTQWAFNKLLRNASLNTGITNITFSKVGLSDSNAGEVSLYFQSSYRLNGKQIYSTENIELLTLDKYISRNNIDRVDFVKMDVDGFEGKIIKGAEKSLMYMKPILLMEINPSVMQLQGDEPADIVQILEKIGYTFETTLGEPIENFSDYLYKELQRSIMILAIPSQSPT
jgi:FkbM family methyltransferase